MRPRYHTVIVGGGIAGASLAWFLAEAGAGDALLLERERAPGRHATGRSAAAWIDYDPDPELARFKRESLEFLRAPPAGFAPLLDACGSLLLDAPGDAAGLRAGGAEVETWDLARARERVPVLGPAACDTALWLPRSGRIDVGALLDGYLGGARRGGVDLATGVEVTGVRAERGRCTGVETRDGVVGCSVVVDAAGAWAGALARAAGAAPIEVAALRRTMAVFEASGAGGWPVVAHAGRGIYFAPARDGVAASPMDEDPVEPCDAAPDSGRVEATARALACVAPALGGRRPLRSWAGLRAFAPDRRPVVGFDPRLRGFFWLAGQGGVGIATSPALGRLAAGAIARGVDTGRLAPSRFA